MRIKLLLKTVFLIVIVFLLNVGCNKKSDIEIVDRAGITVNIKGPINRIVSTAPSNTEIITDLGMAHKLVAVDVHSANVTGIPDGLPLLDFFYPDAEAIINLEPDLIIANGHNASGTGEDPFRLLREMGIAVAYISMSKSIEDIYKDIAFVAELLQVQDKGEQVIQSMKDQISEISEKTLSIKNKKTVYFEISAAPYMFTMGKDSYLNDMINVIGGYNIFENENWSVSPSAESIIERNPDIILTSVNYIDDPIGEIKSRIGFNHINAIIENRVYQIDTDSSVRPSTRILLALNQMAQAVYPELFP
jgi:iron complex transport system substrate-binding protein